MRVGLFDSGVGGLTVLKALRDKYPNNEYIYYGDTFNLPYGIKSKDELEKLSSYNIEFLLNHSVDAIIIACGTISSNCLSFLRKRYSVPIYDIVSPVIKHLNESSYQNICVIATSATIGSHVFRKNVSKNIIEIETPKLVPLIEKNTLQGINQILDEYLSKYRDNIDAIVLGCTHYPIIKSEVEKYFGNRIHVIDMSEYLLPLFSDGDNSSIELYFSKVDQNVIDNVEKILGNSYKIKEERFY